MKKLLLIMAAGMLVLVACSNEEMPEVVEPLIVDGEYVEYDELENNYVDGGAEIDEIEDDFEFVSFTDGFPVELLGLHQDEIHELLGEPNHREWDWYESWYLSSIDGREDKMLTIVFAQHETSGFIVSQVEIHCMNNGDNDAIGIDDFNQLEIGMTELELFELFGEPSIVRKEAIGVYDDGMPRIIRTVAQWGTPDSGTIFWLRLEDGVATYVLIQCLTDYGWLDGTDCE